MRIELSPTVAPFLTERARPQRRDRPSSMLANLADRVRAGHAAAASVSSADAGGRRAARLRRSPTTRWPASLAPTITAAARQRGRRPGSSTTRIGADEPNIEALFPNLFPTFVAALGASFARLPAAELPRSRARRARGGPRTATTSCSTPTCTRCPRPASRTSASPTCSSADCVTDSPFDVNEWRHRHAPDRVAHRGRA